MENVLIYHKKENLAPTGGPRGYLYNLFQGLSKIQINDIQISFLDDLIKGSSNAKAIKEQYDKLPLSIKKLYRIYGRYKEYRNYKACIPTLKIEDISTFDAIHFHDVFALYKNKKILDCYKGKVVLTTHCPKPPHLEKVEDMYSNFERFLYGKKHLSFYEGCVKYAFDRADIIIFPCKEAEEPYYNNWDYYKTIHEKYDSKFVYIPTGLQDCLPKVKQTKDAIREKNNIPDGSFVVSFVGRHNAVKGYDTLREIAESMESTGIYFLIAGEETPLQRPNVNNWREVGWTNDPYSIINASDVFILPNKETYFDLVLLEVLSLGKAVLASKTGGNKYFSKLDSGIELYNNKHQVIELLSRLERNRNMVNEMGVKNRMLFENNFKDEIFAEKYISFLRSI